MRDLDAASRLAVMDVVARAGMAVDQRDWAAAQACFTQELDTDYTSLIGGEPARVKAADLVAAWTEALTPLDAVQHLLGPALVEPDGEAAAARCAGQITHVFGGERWVIGGVYRYRLTREGGAWRIASVAFDLQWQAGDAGLVARAGEAAKG